MTISNKPVAVCPYCQRQHFVTPSYMPAVMCCDAEEGGCDTYFAYQCVEQPRTYRIASSTLVLSPPTIKE